MTDNARYAPYLPVVAMVIAGLLVMPNPAVAVWTLSEMQTERDIAKWQDRPLVYNNDGADVLYGETHTPQGLLDVRTTGVADSQVSTINYCSRSSGFGLFTHNTQVGEIFTSTGGRYYNNMTQDLINQGTDCLEVMVDFARENDKEIFWSMRMNDTHDAHSESAIYAFPQLKEDHPEWLLGSETDRPAYGAWTAINYGVPEVRDLALAYFEEVCLNYDVDGIELDFFRHPYFFQSHADGGTATQADRAAMTQLVRDIRTMTEQISMQREKPILVGIRVPDSMGFCHDIGLDVPQWLDEGIVDLMTVSGYFRAEEWEENVALGHDHDVPVYACLSESRMSGEAGTVRKSQESYKARASNVWASGADGVYMFNYFSDESVLFDILGDTRTLRGEDKVYTTGARAVESMASGLAGGLNYLDRDVVYPTRPSSFSPGQFRIIQMPVGDDIAGSLDEPGETLLEARVQLRLYMDQAMDPTNVLATINGQTLVDGRLEDGYIRYLVDPRVGCAGDEQLRHWRAVGVFQRDYASRFATLCRLQIGRERGRPNFARAILDERLRVGGACWPKPGEFTFRHGLVGRVAPEQRLSVRGDGAFSRGPCQRGRRVCIRIGSVRRRDPQCCANVHPVIRRRTIGRCTI